MATKTKTKAQLEEELASKDAEMTAMKSQYEQMAEMMAAMQQQLAEMRSAPVVDAMPVMPVKKKRYNNVHLVSLCPGILVLEGANGKMHQLNGVFSEKTITANEATYVLQNMSSMYEDGSFTLREKDFVEDEGYSLNVGVLTEEELRAFMDLDPDTAVEKFLATSGSQQRTIINLIYKAVQAKEKLDMNFVMGIQQACNGYVDFYYNPFEEE